MILLVTEHPALRVEGDAPPAAALDLNPLGLGFLGRIGGWDSQGDDACFIAIQAWRRLRNGDVTENACVETSAAAPLLKSQPPSEGQCQIWRCLQDIEGIYDSFSTALLSANHLHLVERRTQEAHRIPLVEAQRRRANTLLGRQPGYLGGAFATGPRSCFLEIGAWQSSPEARHFLNTGRTDLEAELQDAAPSVLGRTRDLRILRRFTLEADVPKAGSPEEMAPKAGGI